MRPAQKAYGFVAASARKGSHDWQICLFAHSGETLQNDRPAPRDSSGDMDPYPRARVDSARTIGGSGSSRKREE